MSAAEMIEYDGRLVRRFVSYPEPVTDRTTRCGVCGQIDDEDFHDEATCAAIFAGATPAEIVRILDAAAEA